MLSRCGGGTAAALVSISIATIHTTAAEAFLASTAVFLSFIIEAKCSLEYFFENRVNEMGTLYVIAISN